MKERRLIHEKKKIKKFSKNLLTNQQNGVIIDLSNEREEILFMKIPTQVFVVSRYLDDHYLYNLGVFSSIKTIKEYLEKRWHFSQDQIEDGLDDYYSSITIYNEKADSKDTFKIEEFYLNI